MTLDMKRLCEAAADVELDNAPDHLHGDGPEAVVRAILHKLREPSDAAYEAMAEALKRPRQHVGHGVSDEIRGAYIALDAYLDHILDTKARRDKALSELAEMDRDLI